MLPLCVRDKGPILQSLCSNSLDWAHQKWQHSLCGDCMTGGLKNPGFTLNHSSVMQRNTLPTHIQSNSSIFTSLLLWFSPLKTKQIKEPHYLLKTNIMGICTVRSRRAFESSRPCGWLQLFWHQCQHFPVWLCYLHASPCCVHAIPECFFSVKRECVCGIFLHNHRVHSVHRALHGLKSAILEDKACSVWDT